MVLRVRIRSAKLLLEANNFSKIVNIYSNRVHTLYSLEAEISLEQALLKIQADNRYGNKQYLLSIIHLILNYKYGHKIQMEMF
jgi:hypothetical protein